MGKWMFKATVWIVAAVLLTASGAQTRDSFAGAFDRLAKVDVFALGLVSFGAQISQGEKDFELIRARPTALADFERLFAVGNPQAKAYALVGIRRINPERYTRLAQPLRSS